MQFTPPRATPRTPPARCVPGHRQQRQQRRARRARGRAGLELETRRRVRPPGLHRLRRPGPVHRAPRPRSASHCVPPPPPSARGPACCLPWWEPGTRPWLGIGTARTPPALARGCLWTCRTQDSSAHRAPALRPPANDATTLQQVQITRGRTWQPRDTHAAGLAKFLPFLGPRPRVAICRSASAAKLLQQAGQSALDRRAPAGSSAAVRGPRRFRAPAPTPLPLLCTQ